MPDNKRPLSGTLFQSINPWTGFSTFTPGDSSSTVGSELSRKVFIVHGHDKETKQYVARFLEKLGFEVVILHEQANMGRTLMEKFEANAEVGFAVILLTPDDVGGTRVGGPQQPRARQNVLLELGYLSEGLGAKECAPSNRVNWKCPPTFLESF